MLVSHMNMNHVYNFFRHDISTQYYLYQFYLWYSLLLSTFAKTFMNMENIYLYTLLYHMLFKIHWPMMYSIFRMSGHPFESTNILVELFGMYGSAFAFFIVECFLNLSHRDIYHIASRIFFYSLFIRARSKSHYLNYQKQIAKQRSIIVQQNSRLPWIVNQQIFDFAFEAPDACILPYFSNKFKQVITIIFTICCVFYGSKILSLFGYYVQYFLLDPNGFKTSLIDSNIQYKNDGWGYIHNDLRDEKYLTDFETRQLCLLIDKDANCF